MKTYTERDGAIEPELVEYNPTPKIKLFDLEDLILGGKEPIRRVFVYTGRFPADHYTRIHPCSGEGKITRVHWYKNNLVTGKKPKASFEIDFERETVVFFVGGSRFFGIPARSYILHLNPLRPEVERDYLSYLVIGGIDEKSNEI